ncbi:DUF6035 family protein [Aquimarina macrocephali]|uniref:DUF6035 family protein n=1 Tax=Aquimarina macrocephali TaxID=666563 RepID=UPI0004634E16|nr:DUF6035 family protein [Aquimarina macrocephali]
MKFERAIKYALNRDTGEVIDASLMFQESKIAHKYREAYNREEFGLHCLECDNPLVISSSKYDKIYLRHSPGSSNCILKDEKFTLEEENRYYDCLKSKESERHIFLKKVIGKYLKDVPQIQNLWIDNRFIYNDQGDKRKPDIYCQYKGKEIVFEIQLSNLSQKYILSRFDFYKQKGIYLIWILDNFDVLGNTQTEKDIKYLSVHQNYFRFDDKVKEFRLNCKFKQTHLSSVNKFYDQWNDVNITLDKLTFDENNKEVYFYNFLKNKEDLLMIQRRNQFKIDKKKKEIDNQRRINEEQEKITYRVYDFLEKISVEKKRKYSDFKELKYELQLFKVSELELLNNRLQIDEKERLFRWVQNGENSEYGFFEFILNSNIHFDINKTDKNGNDVLYHLFKNENIYSKEQFLELFFKRGFVFLQKHEAIVKKSYVEQADYQRLILICQLASKVPKWLLQELFTFKSQRVLCIIHSCIEKQITGFKFKNWIALLNHAIYNYPEYWKYIESTLKSTGLFKEVISLDKKKTFQKKLSNHSHSSVEYNQDFAHLYGHLYPELI